MKSNFSRFLVLVVAMVMCLQLSSLAFAAPVRVGAGMFTQPGANPVNSGLGEPTFRITFMPIDLTVANNTWPLSRIDYYLDKKLDDEAKQAFVAAIPEHGFQLDLGSWTSAGLSVGTINTALSVRTLGTANLSKDLVDLVLNGNELDRDYVLDGSTLGAVAFGDASAGLAFNLSPSIRVGARYHHLAGIGYVHAAASGHGRASYESAPGFEGNMELGYDSIYGQGVHGEGSAYDVGVTIQPTQNLAFGFAVMDFGQIEWRNVNRERYQGSLNSESDPDQGPQWDLTDQEVVEALVWELPRRYEISMGYQLASSLHFGAAFTRTVHEPTHGFTYTTPDRVEGMLSWNGFGIMPIGVGASYAQDDGISFAGEAALRLGPLRTRLRLTDVQSLFGEGQGQDLGVRFDLGIVF